MRYLRHTALLAIALLFVYAGYSVVHAADDPATIQQKIDERNKAIADLEAEIQQYQEQLNAVSSEKQTLENAIKTLDLTRKKISSDIALTENRIDATRDQIRELSSGIADASGRIDESKEAVAESLRAMDESESSSFIEQFLSATTISSVWDAVATLEQFHKSLREHANDLTVMRSSLETTKIATEKKERELAALKADLSGQKSALDANRQEKNSLLTATKNKESGYQALLAQKVAARKKFEAELTDLESALKYALDPSRLPPAGSGVLTWPFESSYMKDCTKFATSLKNQYCITQYFGNTAFAKTGAYNGNGHNGVDFRAPTGTKIESALSGTILGTGNTDSIPGCYSYGKWVMVEHQNGLSTLYAHLSVISVAEGQKVSTGDLLGYSGSSGYATGPHLHFGVYASDGVQIVKLGSVKSITNCGAARIPIAPLNAYLDPMRYL